VTGRSRGRKYLDLIYSLRYYKGAMGFMGLSEEPI